MKNQLTTNNGANRVLRYFLGPVLIIATTAPAHAQHPFTVTGAIRTQNGHFLTAVNGGGLGGPNSGPGVVALHTDATQAGPWETFRILWLDKAHCKFELLTAAANRVTAVNGGGIGGPNNGESPIHTDATRIGPWENFTLNFRADSAHLAIRTSDGRHFVTAVNGGGVGGPNNMPIHTDAKAAGPWERFTLVNQKCP